MDENNVYEKIRNQCPIEYKINEIIMFAFPFRRLKVNVTVCKTPEKSLQQIYSVILRTVRSGFNTEKELCDFLGLHDDDFLLRELYFLREKSYLDLVSNKWQITAEGQKYIEDNNMLMLIAEDEFEFLINAKNGYMVEYENRLFSNVPKEKRLKPDIDFPLFDEKLLNDKDEDLKDLYKKIYKNEAYLIDIRKNKILFDKWEYQDFFLIEYIPIDKKRESLDPFIEIRKADETLKIEKALSKLIWEEYPAIVYELTSSDRKEISTLEKTVEFLDIKEKLTTPFLTVWEAKKQFEKALNEVKKIILIESPWIRKATSNYFNHFEDLLKQEKFLIILYGISEKKDNDSETVTILEDFKNKYPRNFFLIHLPTYFPQVGIHLHGTHKKLVIKDNDYFIAGSYNFLSFNKNEGEKVANEENYLFYENVIEKWEKVLNEYKLYDIKKIIKLVYS